MTRYGKRKILIVDDSELDIAILGEILDEEYFTFAVRTGKDAMEAANTFIPDLILLDVVLPDMSGFDVLARLKSTEATQPIPVIFVTGMDRVEDEERGFSLGAMDYITKPFHNAIVRVRVKTHLQMAEYVRTIERLGMVDPLTNAPNRRAFDLRVDREWQKALREKTGIGILMVDADGFKNCNDTFGHSQGDVLLKAIADIFGRTLKRSTDFFARWGGDEFAVLLSNTDLAGAVRTAEMIRKNVEETAISLDHGKKTRQTVSIGVSAKVPCESDYVDEFIAEADKALYRAKNEGKNRVCYHRQNDT